MAHDKLYSVTLEGDRLVLGMVKAESLDEAIAYCRREYPNYRLTEIAESSRQLL